MWASPGQPFPSPSYRLTLERTTQTVLVALGGPAAALRGRWLQPPWPVGVGEPGPAVWPGARSAGGGLCNRCTPWGPPAS